MYAYVHFEGAETGSQGGAIVDVSFQIVRPDGSIAADVADVPIWRGEAPPAGHLQIGSNNMSFALDSDEPAGAWSVKATVCDVGAQQCVDLDHPFSLHE